MPWGSSESVNLFRGLDCWRTWFIEECEKSHLFGVTGKKLGLVTLANVGIVPSHVGTRLYLEDAPYFHKDRKSHRVCGPYIVQATETLPPDCNPAHMYDGRTIVYRDTHPELGPWLNRSLTRVIDGLKVKYQQTASEYEFFPYRFAIRRAKDWNVIHEPHSSGCPLCR